MFRKKPLEMGRFEDARRIDFNRPDPWWWKLSPFFRVFFWALAIVFFPITLVVMWGIRYRGWFEFWIVGGQAFDPEEEMIDEFPFPEPSPDD